MSAPAIVCASLSKQYQIGSFQGAASRYRTLRDTITDIATWPWRRLSGQAPPAPPEMIWALRNVSFTVQKGEAIGIIGRNGAGKSTLLKVLSRITEPTEGRVEVRGRVASLLEVGTGFHPELTGRENVFLNAAILGMPRRNIVARFDEIVAFSEVEKFIDTPVKRYSSGMRMRLAFAVAAHLDPEILVIDEVLAVGDAEFQKKCLGKMEAVASGGRTVLFVSHSMPAVRRLCTRGLLLRDGEVAAEGSVDHVVNAYLSDVRLTDELVFPEPKDDRPGWISRLCLRGPQGGRGTRFAHSAPITIEVERVVRAASSADRLFVIVSTAEGIDIFNTTETDPAVPLPATRGPGRYVAQLEIPGGILNEGTYQFRVSLGTMTHSTDYRWSSHFEVYDDLEWQATCGGDRHGVMLLLRLPWREERTA